MISIALITALLMISGVPLVSAAKACGLDAMPQNADHVLSEAAMHDSQHGPVLDLPADTCRFECACGCHSHADALPHLLAPHAPCVQDAYTAPAGDTASVLPIRRLSAFIQAVKTPPPRNV